MICFYEYLTVSPRVFDFGENKRRSHSGGAVRTSKFMPIKSEVGMPAWPEYVLHEKRLQFDTILVLRIFHSFQIDLTFQLF